MIGTIDIKKMHHRDPKGTERAAAQKVAPTVKGRRLQTLQALASLVGGGTGEQIAHAARLSILSIRPRLSELQEMQLIEDTQSSRKNAMGNKEIVWRITEEGKKLL